MQRDLSDTAQNQGADVEAEVDAIFAALGAAPMAHSGASQAEISAAAEDDDEALLLLLMG